MELEVDHLTEDERRAVLVVLERDEQLREIDDSRVMKLKEELRKLRLRGVIRSEGGRTEVDANKSCARCRGPLAGANSGWGSPLKSEGGYMCPACLHRVCENCKKVVSRHGEELCLCVYCSKQMEYEAQSGQWFIRLIEKRKKSSTLPGANRPGATPTWARSNSVTSPTRGPERQLSTAELVRRSLVNSRASSMASITTGSSTSLHTSPTTRQSVYRSGASVRHLIQTSCQVDVHVNVTTVTNTLDEVRRALSLAESDHSDDDSPHRPPSNPSPSRSFHSRDHSPGDQNGHAYSNHAGQRPRPSSQYLEQDDGHLLRDLMELTPFTLPARMTTPVSPHLPVCATFSDHSVIHVRKVGRKKSDDSDSDTSGPDFVPPDYGPPSPNSPVYSSSYEVRARENNQNMTSVARNSWRKRSEKNNQDKENCLNDVRSPGSSKRISPGGENPGGIFPGIEDRDSTEFAGGGSTAVFSRMTPLLGSRCRVSGEGEERQNTAGMVRGGSSRSSLTSRTSVEDDPQSLNSGLNPPPTSRGQTPSASSQARDRTASGGSGSSLRLSEARLKAGGGMESEVDGQGSIASGDSMPSFAVTPPIHGAGKPGENQKPPGLEEEGSAEDIGELFASYGGPSGSSVKGSSSSTNRKTGSGSNINQLSPVISGSRESIVSCYSDAGEGQYGRFPVSGEIQFSISYNYKQGVLEIDVRQCRGLAAVDTKKNCSDPYIKTYLLPDRTKNGKRKTKAKRHTLNPVFNEILKYQVTKSELETRTLCLMVWNSDRFGRNDFLGEVNVPLSYYTFDDPTPQWHKLKERTAGQLAMLTYKGDLNICLKFVTSEHISGRKRGSDQAGELHVIIKEAKNLTAVRGNNHSDPFCKGCLLPDRSRRAQVKTPVIKKNCNPKWNHTFLFDGITWEELKERSLELTVWDYDRLTSNDFLGGLRINTGSGKSSGQMVDWMDSSVEEAQLWQAMLDRPNCWVEGTLMLRINMSQRR